MLHSHSTEETEAQTETTLDSLGLTTKSLKAQSVQQSLPSLPFKVRFVCFYSACI